MQLASSISSENWLFSMRMNGTAQQFPLGAGKLNPIIPSQGWAHLMCAIQVAAFKKEMPG
jgi:hypothetical protein